MAANQSKRSRIMLVTGICVGLITLAPLASGADADRSQVPTDQADGAVTASLVVIGLLAGATGATGQVVPATSKPNEAAQPGQLPPVGTRPVGGLRNLFLAQDIFVVNDPLRPETRGAVVGIDEAGTLWAYPGGPGGKLGRPIAIGTGFDGTTLYPVDGDGVSKGRTSYTAVERLLGTNCQGDVQLYYLPYTLMDVNPYTETIGTGWNKHEVIPAGNLTGTKWQSFVLVKNRSTGSLFLHESTYQKIKPKGQQVGNGWANYRIFQAGDVTGNGLSDIFGISPSGNLYLYPSKSDGTFGIKRQIGNGWQGYDLITGADVDGNGHNDLMSRDSSGRLFYYRGLGNGRFATRVQVGHSWGPLDTGPACTAGSTPVGTMLVNPGIHGGRTYIRPLSTDN